MGWLGWSEADTLDASMAGILLAYEGRLDLLKSIFGGGEKSKTPDTLASPGKIKNALRMLGGGKRSGARRGSDTKQPLSRGPQGKPI